MTRCSGAGRLARPLPRCYAQRCLRWRRQCAAEGTSGCRSRRQARGRCYTSRVQIVRARFGSSTPCLSTRIIPFAMRVVRSHPHAHMHARTHLLRHARTQHMRTHPPTRTCCEHAGQTSWTRGSSFRQPRQAMRVGTQPITRTCSLTRMSSLTRMCSLNNTTHGVQGATDHRR